MDFADNASKLHKKVGETLILTPGFKGCPLLQEVIVSELFPTYPNNRDRYDWVILKRQTIIECHGVQHYKVQSFGTSADQAVMNFQTQKNRDNHKQEIALLSGWTYLIIPYTDIDKITPAYIMELYETNLNTDKSIIPEEAKTTDVYHEQLLERAREYRKQQYQRMKVIKNEHRRSSTRTTDSSKEEA